MSRNREKKETSWVVKVRHADLKPMWFGNFSAEGRQDAKRKARLFVSEHFPLDTQILAIARGRVILELHEDPIPFDSIED